MSEKPKQITPIDFLNYQLHTISTQLQNHQTQVDSLKLHINNVYNMHLAQCQTYECIIKWIELGHKRKDFTIEKYKSIINTK